MFRYVMLRGAEHRVHCHEGRGARGSVGDAGGGGRGVEASGGVGKGGTGSVGQEGEDERADRSGADALRTGGHSTLCGASPRVRSG